MATFLGIYIPFSSLFEQNEGKSLGHKVLLNELALDLHTGREQKSKRRRTVASCTRILLGGGWLFSSFLGIWGRGNPYNITHLLCSPCDQ